MRVCVVMGPILDRLWVMKGKWVQLFSEGSIYFCWRQELVLAICTYFEGV